MYICISVSVYIYICAIPSGSRKGFPESKGEQHGSSTNSNMAPQQHRSYEVTNNYRYYHNKCISVYSTNNNNNSNNE